MEARPGDARAPLYLGNLLYDHQPEAALRMWERSRALDGSLALTHRNLAFAYGRAGKHGEAVNALKRAVALDDSDARLLYELDVQREVAGMAPEDRLAQIKGHWKTLQKRDDAMARGMALMVLTGAYDEAIKTLTTRHFNVWEGGGAIHVTFVDAHLLRGLRFLRTGESEKALADFETALTYPRNLEVGRPTPDPMAARANYYIGLAHRRLGHAADAAHVLGQVADADVGNSDYRYFKGLALRALGRGDEADVLFNALEEDGRERLGPGEAEDFFAKFGGRRSENMRRATGLYTVGLGLLGQGKTPEGKAALEEARQLDPTRPWYDSALYRD